MSQTLLASLGPSERGAGTREELLQLAWDRARGLGSVPAIKLLMGEVPHPDTAHESVSVIAGLATGRRSAKKNAREEEE